MLETVLALSAAVNRAVELVKAFVLKELDLDEEYGKGITLLLSLVFGVLAAFGADVNVFADNAFYGANIPPVLATIISGLIVGLGSNAVHAVFDVLYLFKERARNPQDVVVLYDDEYDDDDDRELKG